MVSPAAWFIRQRAAHEYSSSAPRRVARFLGIMCAATLLSGLISSFAARAQPTQPTPAPSATAQPSAEEAAKREAWRATIARAPAPKKGCFTAPYPKTEWQEFPCAPPSWYPNQASGPRPDTVGLGSDYSAQVSGISSAAGSFDGVTPAAITEGGLWWGKNCPPPIPLPCHPTQPCIHPDHDGAAAPTCTQPTSNAFSLQLNTQYFPTTACRGVTECRGWQQFVFSQDQCNGPYVFIEYWLRTELPNRTLDSVC
jgi:hypothetical protein